MTEQPRSPSREFLVQQAVLNAIASELPSSLACRGPRHCAEFILCQPERLDIRGPVPSLWVDTIRTEYRALAARYGVAT